MRTRSIRWGGIATIVCAVAATPILAADSPAVGRWNIFVKKGDKVGVCWLAIRAEGGKYLGRFNPESGGMHDTGEIKIDGDHIAFNTRGQGEPDFTGTLKGDTMGGMRMRGDEKQEWTATRCNPKIDVAGKWALSVQGPSRRASGVLALAQKDDQITGAIQRRREIPVGQAKLVNGVLTFAAGKGKAAAQYEAKVKGDVLDGEITNANGEKVKFTAQRERKWGEPIELFNGKDLAGWKPLGDEREFKWTVVDGLLTAAGHGANIVTEKKFKDFKLHVEFRVPPQGNSGVYLRGRCEIQVADSFGQEPTGSSCGAIYTRIVPSKNASKPAGEWQTFDAAIIGQYLTVVHNGVTIIDNQEVEGMTGGAIDNKDDEPGPIYLQGDHTMIEYRKVTLTPALPAAGQ